MGRGLHGHHDYIFSLYFTIVDKSIFWFNIYLLYNNIDPTKRSEPLAKGTWFSQFGHWFPEHHKHTVHLSIVAVEKNILLKFSTFLLYDLVGPAIRPESIEQWRFFKVPRLPFIMVISEVKNLNIFNFSVFDDTSDEILVYLHAFNTMKPQVKSFEVFFVI